ncbi:MAG: hypothetical protein ACTSPB_01290 [Candidatus Thorarchaeota archaeon]
MNHQQINNLKVGATYELQEEYTYKIDFLGDKSPVIPKGTQMKYLHSVLNGYVFGFDKVFESPLGLECTFGRSRLLKMKLKEVES